MIRTEFGKRQIKIVDARTIEKSARRIPQLSERLCAERRPIKFGPPIPRIQVDIQRGTTVFRCVQQMVVEAISQSSKQRIVGIVVESHGKPGAETSCPRHTPSVRQSIASRENAIEWQARPDNLRQSCASYQTLKSLESPGVQWIKLLAQIRTLIDRFAVSVSEQKIRSPADVPQIGFERIEVRIRNCLLSGDLSVIGTQADSRPVVHLPRAAGYDGIFGKGSAGEAAGRDLTWLAEAETKRLVAGVCRDYSENVVPLISHVARRQQHARRDLALETRSV